MSENVRQIQDRVNELKAQLSAAETELCQIQQQEVDDAVKQIRNLFEQLHGQLTEEQWADVCIELVTFESHPHDACGKHWRVRLGKTPVFSASISLAEQSIKFGGL